jgi:hypothetical protein
MTTSVMLMLAVAALAAVAVPAVMWLGRRRHQPHDGLGAMSAQWINEQRSAHPLL